LEEGRHCGGGCEERGEEEERYQEELGCWVNGGWFGGVVDGCCCRDGCRGEMCML
jgi:hypothetical protein